MTPDKHRHRRELDRASSFLSFSTRTCSSGVFAGIELVMRIQANGAMQFERTL